MKCPLCNASDEYIYIDILEKANVESGVNSGKYFQIYTCDSCKCKWIMLLGQDGSKEKLLRD